jgi:hypothetical protein
VLDVEDVEVDVGVEDVEVTLIFANCQFRDLFERASIDFTGASRTAAQAQLVPDVARYVAKQEILL